MLINKNSSLEHSLQVAAVVTYEVRHEHKLIHSMDTTGPCSADFTLLQEPVMSMMWMSL